MIAYTGTCIITFTFHTLNTYFLYHFSYITNTCFHSIFSTCQKTSFCLVYFIYYEFSFRILFFLFETCFLYSNLVFLIVLEVIFGPRSCHYDGSRRVGMFHISFILFQVFISCLSLEFDCLYKTLNSPYLKGLFRQRSSTTLIILLERAHLYYFPTFLLYFRLLL